MRWNVEVAAAAQDQAFEQWVVDAASWSLALEAARRLRGDVGPLEGFAIEAIEDGWRVLDPVRWVRFSVRAASGAMGAPGDHEATPLSGRDLRPRAASEPPARAVVQMRHGLADERSSSAAQEPQPDAGGDRSPGSPVSVSVDLRTTLRSGTEPPRSVFAVEVVAPRSVRASQPALESALSRTPPPAGVPGTVAPTASPARAPHPPAEAIATGSARPSHPPADQAIATGSARPSPSPFAVTAAISTPVATTSAEPARASRSPVAAAATPTGTPVATAAPRSSSFASTASFGTPIPPRTGTEVTPSQPPAGRSLAQPPAGAPVAAAPVAHPHAGASAAHSPRTIQASHPTPAPPPSTPPGPRPYAASATPSSPPLAPRPSTPAPLFQLPSPQLIYRRDEDPTELSPLTYRESAWIVPEGTSVEMAAALLRGVFEYVRSGIAHMPTGKLVNIAIFDHVFECKPQRPPLASLTWKDWRSSEPVIRRLGDAPTPSVPPSGVSAFAAQRASTPWPPVVTASALSKPVPIPWDSPGQRPPTSVPPGDPSRPDVSRRAAPGVVQSSPPIAQPSRAATGFASIEVGSTEPVPLRSSSAAGEPLSLRAAIVDETEPPQVAVAPVTGAAVTGAAVTGSAAVAPVVAPAAASVESVASESAGAPLQHVPPAERSAALPPTGPMPSPTGEAVFGDIEPRGAPSTPEPPALASESGQSGAAPVPVAPEPVAVAAEPVLSAGHPHGRGPDARRSAPFANSTEASLPISEGPSADPSGRYTPAVPISVPPAARHEPDDPVSSCKPTLRVHPTVLALLVAEPSPDRSAGQPAKTVTAESTAHANRTAAQSAAEGLPCDASSETASTDASASRVDAEAAATSASPGEAPSATLSVSVSGPAGAEPSPACPIGVPEGYAAMKPGAVPATGEVLTTGEVSTMGAVPTTDEVSTTGAVPATHEVSTTGAVPATHEVSTTGAVPATGEVSVMGAATTDAVAPTGEGVSDRERELTDAAPGAPGAADLGSRGLGLGAAPGANSPNAHETDASVAVVLPGQTLSAAQTTTSSAPPSRQSSIPGIRLTGDDLITELFEAVHGLHFMADSPSAADFVLALALEKLPSRLGMVHFYDIDAREFVVVSAAGRKADAVVGHRTSERDPLIAAAMARRTAVVINDPMSELIRNARWAAAGSACRSVVCAPVELAGRFLGVIELANPRDGASFTDGDGNALTYMAQQLAEFLATHGLNFEPRRPSRSTS